MDVIASRLNCSYELFRRRDMVWGNPGPDPGTATGMAGSMHRREGDLVVASLTITGAR